jgi:hypothetical protein
LSEKKPYKSQATQPAPRRPNFIPSTPNYLKYNWLDKDPDMDLIVALIGEAGFSPEDVEHETEKLGHKVSRYTVMNWLYGGVRRPQNYTMTIVALACGYSKTWAPLSQKDAQPAPSVQKPTPRAQEARAYVRH